MGKGLFSEGHNPENQPRGKRKSGARKAKPVSSGDGDINFAPGKPTVLTDIERRELRLKQLARAGRAAAGSDPVPRRQYIRQDGKVMESYQSEDTVQKPPRTDLRRVRKTVQQLNFNDPDKEDVAGRDPDLRNESDKVQPQKLKINWGKVVGALSILDKGIQKIHLHEIDNANQAVNNLHTAITDLVGKLQGDEPAEVVNAVNQLQWIVEEAMLPWFPILKQHIDTVIRGTKEATVVKEREGEIPEEEEF